MTKQWTRTGAATYVFNVKAHHWILEQIVFITSDCFKTDLSALRWHFFSVQTRPHANSADTRRVQVKRDAIRFDLRVDEDSLNYPSSAALWSQLRTRNSAQASHLKPPPAVQLPEWGGCGDCRLEVYTWNGSCAAEEPSLFPVFGKLCADPQSKCKCC